MTSRSEITLLGSDEESMAVQEGRSREIWIESWRLHTGPQIKG